MSAARIHGSVVLVMGVAASGKSTLGKALAAELDWRFLEGDDFHPQENRNKMASGSPLNDLDRWPWLDAIGAAVLSHARDKRSVVIACSALKKSYRERLAAACGLDAIVHLHGSQSILEARIAQRAGHFMPASLLVSQLETLETPSSSDSVCSIDVALPEQCQLKTALAFVEHKLALGFG